MTEEDERALANEAIGLKLKLNSEVEDTRGHTGIATVVLVRARQAAVAAMFDIIDADPFKPELIRALQGNVRRYIDMVTWVQEAIDQGTAHQEKFAAEDIQAVRIDLRSERNVDTGSDQYED